MSSTKRKRFSIQQLHRKKSALSPVQLGRLDYSPPLPPCLQYPGSVAVKQLEATQSQVERDAEIIQRCFPSTYGAKLIELEAGAEGTLKGSKRIGVAFCGRQASGGHNVIGGLHDFLKGVDSKSTLIGFLGGTEGLYENHGVEVTADMLTLYRNQGGFDLLARTVDKVRTPAQFEAAKKTCTDLNLDGLVLIGGVRTNTDAAHLAEYFAENKVKTSVVGVPGGIDGSFKNQFVETSFGFDTACKVYSQLIGNIATDGNSAKKYYYFLRLMGNAPSHINLECALQTHPNVTVLSEEVSARKKSLADITSEICDTICKRAECDKNFGTILLPEGLVSAIPEMSALITEINNLIKEGVANTDDDLVSKLTPWGSALLSYLPPFIREQLLLEREAHGTVQLSQIETERLLAWTVDEELKKRKQAGKYKGKLSAICSFFGYQARCSMPSNFDAKFGNSLGQCAAALVYNGLNGYLANVTNLTKPVEEWKVGGVPLCAMTTTGGTSLDDGKIRPTIPMTLVNTHGAAFKLLKENEKKWEMEDCYQNPGPIQFEGPVADACTQTLAVEGHNYQAKLEYMREAIASIRTTCRPGCSDDVLGAATASLKTLVDVLAIIRAGEDQ